MTLNIIIFQSVKKYPGDPPLPPPPILEPHIPTWHEWGEYEIPHVYNVLYGALQLGRLIIKGY